MDVFQATIQMPDNYCLLFTIGIWDYDYLQYWDPHLPFENWNICYLDDFLPLELLQVVFQTDPHDLNTKLVCYSDICENQIHNNATPWIAWGEARDKQEIKKGLNAWISRVTKMREVWHKGLKHYDH